MGQKRYYWLQLKESFFEEDTISWLEEQENGVSYSNFYLKLCLKSLKTNGILVRNVGEILIPYDIKKLADICHVKLDTAIVAMELFKKIGLVQILENGEIYLTQVELMVGSETNKAELMRKKREREKQNILNEGNNVTEKLLNCYTEKEKEQDQKIETTKILEKDKRQEKEHENSLSSVVSSNIKVFKHFEKCGFIVTEKLMEFIEADIEIYSHDWLMDAASECVKRGKLNNYGYLIGILQNWQAKGRDSLAKNESKVTASISNRNKANADIYNGSRINAAFYNKSRANAAAYTEMKSILDE